MKMRFTAVLIIICLMFGALASVSAAHAENISVYVVFNTLNVYNKPSESSTLLGVMAYGEKMTRTAISDEWVRVKNSKGATGYCKSNGVSVNNPNQYSSTVYVSIDKAKIYKKPVDSSKVLARLPVGAEYTCVAVTADGEWYRLKSGKHFGYVQKENISSVPVMTEKADTQVYVSANLLQVYQSASESSKLLATMPFGYSMHCAYVSGGWACVESSKGAVGFCSINGLTKSDPCKLSRTVSINTDTADVYQKPSESSKVIVTLKFNACCTAVGQTTDGEWYRLKNGKHYGYIQSKYVYNESSADAKNNAVAKETTVYVTDTCLHVYSKADTTSHILGDMYFGEKMTCVDTKSGWAKVKNSAGTAGYCRISGLALQDPNENRAALFVRDGGAKVYAKPDKNSNAITTLNACAQVTVVAVSKDRKWVRVESDCSYAYIPSSNLSKHTSSASGVGKSNTITSLTRSLLGKPCVYGAEGPEKFDCSGLAVYVYKTIAGIDLERTAYRQGYDKRFQTIRNIDDLKPGDLVFFNTDRTFVEGGDIDLCDSVGIYMGEKSFIYSSATARKVITRSLSEGSFYYKNFSWGKRIIK